MAATTLDDDALTPSKGADEVVVKAWLVPARQLAAVKSAREPQAVELRMLPSRTAPSGCRPKWRKSRCKLDRGKTQRSRCEQSFVFIENAESIAIVVRC